MTARKETKKSPTLSTTTSVTTLLFVSLLGFTLIQQSIAGYLQDSTIPAGTVAGTSAVSAEVPVTPTNTLYADLQKQQAALNKKDQELRAKESYLNNKLQPTPAAIRTLYVLVSCLFLMVIINFIFDVRRQRLRHSEGV